MFEKKIQHFIYLLFCLLAASSSFAQESPVWDYADKGDYEIAGVNIVGAESRDRSAIKSIAGLSVGDKIKIPGTDIPKAIKALMKLQLFDDVKVTGDSIVDDKIFLTLTLVERPTLSRYSFKGIKKSHHDDLNDILKRILNKGGIITESQKDLARQKIIAHYHDRGRTDVTVDIEEIDDKIKPNSRRLVFDIDEGKKIRIDDITFEGNNEFSAYRLRDKMPETKRKCTWFKKSKLITKDFEDDKKQLISYYNEKGFRDAVVKKDSIWRDPETGNLRVHITLDEGSQYFFRDIKWKGNSIYTDKQLDAILGINKGDVFNPKLLESRLRYSQEGRDVSTLYMDDGYLFFQIDPVEIAVENDSIDLEMRITEGPQATIANVTIKGNDRTHEDVIRRALRTRPGQKFSRSNIIRSQRELINLGYFNPEAIKINTPVNPQRGTVDIEYEVEERSSDQLELSAGLGAGSLIGTLGVQFNNFSIANIKDRSTWNPLPQGDGQKLSVRLQSTGRFYRSYNFSFIEPWLGGKSPTALSLGAVYSKFDRSASGLGSLGTLTLYGGIGKQLKWPDDYFSTSTNLSFQKIDLNNWGDRDFSVTRGGRRFNIDNGTFYNINISQTFTRSSINNPLFPRRGSRVSMSVQLTPPYSLFSDRSITPVSEAELDRLVQVEREERGPANPPSQADIDALRIKVENARRYQFLEYHKWKISTEWYFNIIDKLVFKAEAKFGFLGSYNSTLGAPPFERFRLGGDGLNNQNQGIAGIDIISLRGYDVNEIMGNGSNTATIYDKFNIELRYPLSLNPSSTIYFKTFLQAGNAWTDPGDFNPFEVKKSVGVGLRVFLPMFGLLGFDYAIGIDKNLPKGTSLKEYGRFGIILGMEPE